MSVCNTFLSLFRPGIVIEAGPDMPWEANVPVGERTLGTAAALPGHACLGQLCGAGIHGPGAHAKRQLQRQHARRRSRILEPAPVLGQRQGRGSDR